MAAQGLAGLDADKMKLVQDLEIEMMTDMYARLTAACHKKCIPPKVRSSILPVKCNKCGHKFWMKRHFIGPYAKKTSLDILFISVSRSRSTERGIRMH